MEKNNVSTLQHLQGQPSATGALADCMCTANDPGILHVRHPGWRHFETALVLQAFSSPKGS